MKFKSFRWKWRTNWARQCRHFEKNMSWFDQIKWKRHERKMNFGEKYVWYNLSELFTLESNTQNRVLASIFCFIEPIVLRTFIKCFWKLQKKYSVRIVPNKPLCCHYIFTMVTFVIFSFKMSWMKRYHM